jgi:hypothetical protein
MATCASLLVGLALLALLVPVLAWLVGKLTPKSYWDRDASDLRRRWHYYTAGNTP